MNVQLGYARLNGSKRRTLPTAREPHILHLVALAINFEGMLRDGVVRDQTELARLARVTQPRMTQIMNLNFLAPDIQEAILFVGGDTSVSEKALRPITVEPSWVVQRRMWLASFGSLRRNESDAQRRPSPRLVTARHVYQTIPAEAGHPQ
jgi:hypothetical protein